jgi:hypothetical protein
MNSRLARWALVVIALGLSTLAFAQTALQRQIGYSGFLRRSDGTVVGATSEELVNLTFSIYNVSSSGTALWTETQNNIVVLDGEFSVNLGQVASLDTLDFTNNTQYWLGININGTGELSPRKKLLSVPYTFDAPRDVVERRTSDPTTPVTGQIWLRTDL